MKIRELIESRQQLNEFAPLAALATQLPAGLSWLATASVTAIVLWIINVVGVIEIGKLVKNVVSRDGIDPRCWSEQSTEEVLTLILWTALGSAALHHIGKHVVAGIVAMWPDELQKSILTSLPQFKDIQPMDCAKPKPTPTTSLSGDVWKKVGIPGQRKPTQTAAPVNPITTQ